jgi:hypothetical protein
MCYIGNASFKRALYNLGASISVMPKYIYDSLSLEPLLKLVLWCNLPLGVIEDVLVKIDSLVIHATFIFLIWNVIP